MIDPKRFVDPWRFVLVALKRSERAIGNSRSSDACYESFGFTMSNPNREFVKVYDFASREIVTIPASELTAGMVRIRLRGTDEIIWADSAQLKQGGYRHVPFTGLLREKIVSIQRILSQVYPNTYEFWEDGFRRDLHAEQEIDLWGQVARCFADFVALHALNADERQEAFKLLVACLNGTPSTVFETVSLAVLDHSCAQQLVDFFFTRESKA